MFKLLAFAVIGVVFALSAVGQRNPTTDVPVRGVVYEPAKLPPSTARIKSLKVPPGFSVSKFAELTNPRIIAVSGNGTVYVSQRDPGTLTMLRDTNNDGVAEIQKVVAEKKQMHGVWVEGNEIFLATVKEVFRAPIKDDGTLGDLRMIINDLPDGGQHPNRTIAVKNGKLFISVGSTCNECHESNKEHATMLISDLDGKNRRIFATGLRNTIGFAWHPVTGAFYGMDHGIDWLGDDEQPEELNELKEGAKYGWPYVFGIGKLNPHSEPPSAVGLTNEDWAKQSENPILTYTGHAAPMQMIFYTGSQFPAEYKNNAFVAMRGSWNRSRPSGYEIVRIRFDSSGKGLSFEPFLTGFLVKGGAPDGKDGMFGRLVGLGQMPDGSIIFSDDTHGMIYRVSSNKETAPQIMSRDQISSLLSETQTSGKISVTSSAFADLSAIPDKYSAYFQDVSPEIKWSGVPKNAKSLVLMMEDPDAAIKPVTHWLIANISPSITGLPENVMKTDRYGDALQGGNHTGKLGYFGPMPPRGDAPHKYHFQVFALDAMLDLPTGFNRQALLNAMKGHVIAKGETVGTYQRKPDVREKP